MVSGKSCIVLRMLTPSWTGAACVADHLARILPPRPERVQALSVPGGLGSPAWTTG